jgi:glutamyl-tRNA reductase
MSCEQGTTGRVLNRLFHQAFEVSKRVRTETKIAEGKTSVSSVAVDVAKRIFEDFSSKQTLVVGAGDMAQLVCQYLRDANASKFVVTTRTLANARLLAEACQGEAVPYSQLDEQLIHADIVITASACPVPFITAERVREAQKRRQGRLLFFIDLAVPRNVDASVSHLEQVYVYDIDALGKIVTETREQRNAQLQTCERILDEEISVFEKWLDQTRLNPLIEQMFRDAHDLCSAELTRLHRRCPDLSEEQRKEIELLVDRLAGKFMHPCVNGLRRRSATPHFADEFHAAANKARQLADD